MRSVAVAALMLAACGDSTAAPAPTQTPTRTPTQTPAQTQTPTQTQARVRWPARLRERSGEVRSDPVGPLPAAGGGDPLPFGTRVTLGDDAARAAIDFEDGARVELSEQAVVVIGELADHELFVLRGRAHVILPPDTRPHPVVRVVTPAGTAETISGEIRATVASRGGSVRIEPLAGQVFWSDGERAAGESGDAAREALPLGQPQATLVGNPIAQLGAELDEALGAVEAEVRRGDAVEIEHRDAVQKQLRSRVAELMRELAAHGQRLVAARRLALVRAERLEAVERYGDPAADPPQSRARRERIFAALGRELPARE